MAESKPPGTGWLIAIAAAVAGMKCGIAYGAEYGWSAAGAVCLLGWVAHSWFWPLTDCWWCKNRTRRRTKRGTGKTFHFCRFCDGTGRQPRFLTRVTGRGFGRM